MAIWSRFMLANGGLFLLALVIYGIGAFGFELLSTEIAIRQGMSVPYIVVASIEELGEMAGCFLLFLATLGLAAPPKEIAPDW